MLLTYKVNDEVVEKEFTSSQELHEFIESLEPECVVGVHNEEENNC